jgi:fructokinase
MCTFGDALWQASQESGLDLRYLQRYARAPLLAVVACADPPDYFFIGNDSADLQFDPALLPPGWADEVRWLHVGGISLARAPLAGRLLALARHAKARGVRISYDPNFRNLMDASYDEMLHAMTALADVIKVSDEDLCGLFRVADPIAGLVRLRAMNPQALVLHTAGARGASLYRADAVWHAVTPAIRVLDTVGAGDACMAGLLCSIDSYPTRPWHQHLAFAVAAGAAACCHAGAHAPTRQEIERLLLASPGSV